MIPEFGQYALILAFCLAIIQAILPLLGVWRHRLALMQTARPLAVGQFVFIGTAFFILAYCFLTNDFSVAYVAENSNRQLPMIYRFCAIWGAHEGSLLLWIFILSIWMLLVSIFSKSLPIETIARVLAVLAMISFGFLLFSLMTSNPFGRILPNPPANGVDLNPLLQDPGLAIHPPMLYMGYVGFAVAFAFAIAALLAGKLDATWARWSRPWTTIAWCFLTFGIVLGSWWAYRELGWGGWWFWDPVENASFLPWLVGTALIHSLAVSEQRDTFKAWTVLLAITAFSLSLMGTFLVRSGVLISVHAFAEDPARGAFMLKFLFIVIGLSLALYAWRARKLQSEVGFDWLSRETFLIANNVILVVAMVMVLLGTLYPLIIQALGLGKLSVGEPYFNSVFPPLMLPLLVLIGIGPLLNWKRSSFSKLMHLIRWSFLASLVCGVVIPWVFLGKFSLVLTVTTILVAWIVINTLAFMFHKNRFGKIKLKVLTRSQWGMVIAHLGLAVSVLGVVIAYHFSLNADVKMLVGDSSKLGAYVFKLESVNGVSGPNYVGDQAHILISEKGQVVASLYPQLRLYPDRKMSIAKSAIDVGMFRDLYVALADPVGKNAWALRIYEKSFVRWIWYGGLMMMLGGVLAVSDKRYRIKLLKKKDKFHG